MWIATNKRTAWAALFGLVLLLMMPNFVWLITAGGGAWRSALLMPCASLLILFALFAKRLWLACLLLAPFAALAPAEIFYVARYSHPSTAQVLATIFATNLGETIAYFGNGLWLLFASMLGSLLLALLACRLSFVNRLTWTHRSHVWVVVSTFALLVMACLIGLLGPRKAANSFQAIIAPISAALVQTIDSYPFGVPKRVLDYLDERRELAENATALAAYRFGAARQKIPQREIYVLVIGESSSREFWQLFGYSRPTTPELSSLNNLILMPDMLASWSASIAAIPLVITRKPITELRLGWKEPSIVRAMREAGFETWWISNQLAMGAHDSPVSTYAVEAEHALFVNRTSKNEEASFDDLLLQPLHEAIAGSSRDLFVVLHTMGSHQSYDSRYPASFRRFTPVYSDDDSDVPSAFRLHNSYDNTILYTDHVLASVIAQLQQSGAVAALWYESDHGETLPTPACPYASHGLNTRSEFEIPALFWFSGAYAQAFPERVHIVRENATKKILSRNTFESLLDMTGVEMPDRDATWSLFNPQWAYHKRFVNLVQATAATEVDFDEATFDNACAVPQAVSASVSQ
jgi:glucan phosphoethanolaminetransferase (alkaline phosphatase superfamily)